MLRATPTTLPRTPQPTGAVVDEYGIAWSDGLFSGPFASAEEAAEYVETVGDTAGVTGQFVVRTIEYGAWRGVSG